MSSTRSPASLGFNKTWDWATGSRKMGTESRRRRYFSQCTQAVWGADAGSFLTDEHDRKNRDAIFLQ
jgi:hypothetical protein